eukprot:c20346_g1_i2.p1 GENE.c20346_g1_i2~~c20346_g1_i2.p1  ORF type:complete len:580 (-),score=106.18 c20346_g1_i2:282-2021(-)
MQPYIESEGRGKLQKWERVKTPLTFENSFNAPDESDEVLFPNWTVPSNLNFVTDWVKYTPFTGETTISIKSQNPIVLPSLAAAVLKDCEISKKWTDRLPGKQNISEDSIRPALGFVRELKNDAASYKQVALSAGGAVWAMDWAPNKKISNLWPCEYLAIACHSNHKPLQRANEIGSGPNSIQIWNLGYMTNKGATRGEVLQNVPNLAMILCHNGDFARDIKFIPYAEALTTTHEVPRLGLLAAAFRDGSVAVYAVPIPSYALETRFCEATGIQRGSAPISVELPPIIRIDVSPSVPSCICWWHSEPVEWNLPEADEDTKTTRRNRQATMNAARIKSNPLQGRHCLVVGTHDGRVLHYDVTKIHDATEETPSESEYLPYLELFEECGFIRSLTFNPNCPQYFAYAAANQIVLYDLTRPHGPLHSQPLARDHISSIEWHLGEGGVLVCVEGGVRYFDCFQQNLSGYYPHGNHVWNIAQSRHLKHVASCCAGGQIQVAPMGTTNVKSEVPIPPNASLGSFDLAKNLWRVVLLNSKVASDTEGCQGIQTSGKKIIQNSETSLWIYDRFLVLLFCFVGSRSWVC